MRPIKGVSMVFESKKRLFKNNIWFKKIYVAPRQNNQFAIGATEDEKGFEKYVTLDEIFYLSSSIWEYLPQIENLRFLKAIDEKTLFVSLASSISSINDFVESEGIKNIIFTHPISGSHKSGYENASPNLFNQKNVISVNVNDLQENQTHEIEKIWSSIGSNIINMSLDDHERFLMFTSHLPHLIAFTTMLSIDDEVDISKFSAGGLKEFLRIAESNPDLWADIFSSNSKNLKVGSEIFINNLNKIIDLFKDPETLKELLAEIRNKKQKL